MRPPYRTRIEDVPLERDLREDEGWIDMQVQFLIAEQNAGASDLVVGRTVLPPGARHERHLHPNCDEVLYVLEGELDHSLGEAIYHLTPGALLHIPVDTPHDARNTGTVTARVVIAYSAADRQTVLLEEQ